MNRSLLFCLFACSLVACSDDDDAARSKAAGTKVCTASSQCSAGQICQQGHCKTFEGCSATSCAAGQFCDLDFQCKTVAQKCAAAPGGCECHIANAAGQLVDDASAAAFVVPTGTRIEPSVALATKNGTLLPGAAYALSLDGASAASFSLDGTAVVATAQAGAATLTARVDGFATCTVTLRNLGPTQDGAARFFVFDDVTGAPIAGATVVVESDASGPVADVAPTGAEGVTTAAARFAGPYTVSVFKAGYHYLSFVGLDATRDVALPLTLRDNATRVAGYSGTVDFQSYEQRYLNNKPLPLKVAYAGSSVPMSALLSLDPTLVLGQIGLPKCNISPLPPECYPLKIEGMFDGHIALPPGAVLGLGADVLKPQFDAAGYPGRRYGWVAGAELPGDQIMRLMAPVLDTMSIEDRKDLSHFDINKIDLAKLDIGPIVKELVAILPQAAIGVKANLPLQAAPLSAWKAHSAIKDLASRPADARFPLLAGAQGDLGALALHEGMNKVAVLDVPDLPKDALAGDGGSMELMFIVTGINAPGYGFVPMGVGFGLDCTQGLCFDRSKNFNGRVNGLPLCEGRKCAADMPKDTAEGQVALFRAAAFGGLENQEWITVAIAAPLSTLFAGTPPRATAFVMRGEPPVGRSDWLKGHSYPAMPTTPTDVHGRRYELSGQRTALQWLTFSDEDAAAVRWHVYVAGAASAFKAPAVPAGFADPLAPNGGADAYATHMALTLQDGVTLDALAKNNGKGLGQLVSVTHGFAVRHATFKISP